MCTLPLPTSSQPITQIQFHPSQPLILLQTSERATTVLRIRSEEEVAAKRARRKKRDREKTKKKGAAAVEENELEDASPVKWEERIQAWCIIRSNAKVRSFDLGPAETSAKGGIPVGPPLHFLFTAHSRSCWPCPTIPWKPTPFPPPRPPRSPSFPMEHRRNLPRHIRWSCLAIDKISGQYAYPPTTKSSPRLLVGRSRSGMAGPPRV